MQIIAMADGCVDAVQQKEYSIFELKILLTDKCNFACRYCPVFKGNNELPVSLGSDVVKDFSAISGKKFQVSFSGGEPLLAFLSLVRIVEQFSSRGIKFALTTNGTLSTQEIISYLKARHFEIKVSIDGVPVLHNRNRIFKKKASFSLVRNGLMNYLDGGYPVKTNMVFTPATVFKIVDNLKYISSMGVRYIDIQPDISAFWHSDRLKDAAVAFEEFTKYYISLFQKNSRGFVIPSLRGLMGRRLNPKGKICHKVSLFPDGKYYLCDRLIWLPQRLRDPFCIGIAGKGIDCVRRQKIFNELFIRIRRETGSRCQKCNLLSFCCCPVGSFIICQQLGMPYGEYFKGFCALSRIYLNSYLKIFSSLCNNPRFISAYA